MLERFKTMSPEEQQQFIARMKERGGDTSAFEAAMTAGAAGRGAAAASPAIAAQTIEHCSLPCRSLKRAAARGCSSTAS